ncbi:ABC transporter permease subunit [Sulfolobus sp. S-194]|uniref:ABC transporter permease subunit n=1 Tax=Sulfolobus sp. S-194 TaxID=2512240 RepID=UPI00143723C3|nr:ABC transporter permease subunit [Sulfolobus sp. S-194]QIW23459.1 ABC transporter permease subunit [Sulfolobus sp. S-194]
MNISLLITFTLASLVTIGRVWVTILFSIFSGWLLAYASIKNKIFENIYISLIEVFESVPVFSFFPIVLIFFIYDIGGSLGVEFAVLFLVFTAVTWNIWMGEYQAFKTVPEDLLEVSENYRLKFWGTMTKLYIPFSIPRIAANLIPSFADALFYITVSEVFAVGTHTYQVFGIGTVIANLVSEGDYTDALYGIVVLAIFTIVITLLLREFSKYSVERYGLDTEISIRKRGRIHFGYSTRLVNALSYPAKLAKVFPTPIKLRSNIKEEDEEKEHKYFWKISGIIAGVLLLGLILYGAISTIISVPLSIWGYLISTLPSDLIAILFDYIRVGIIALLSFVFAIFVGYYLTTHERVEKIVIPIIQAYSAIPAPAYYPLFLLVTLPFVHSIFGPLTNEFYVLFLGFISTFYYVFYSFWIGIKNLPQQYWEIMKNYDFRFWQKLRYVIIPGTFPYIIAGLSSTINSAWGGLAIGEYWPDIIQNYNLEVHTGMMKLIDVSTNEGNIVLASWVSLIFGIIVAVYSILFTRKLMDLARKKYIAEEGIYLA